jgi:hypothetical protein
MTATAMSPPDLPQAPAGRDFPFYDGQPVGISAAKWAFLLGMTAVGFAALVGLQHVWPGEAGRWSGILLFAALPLLGLRLVAGRHWAAIFRRPTARDVLIGLAFVPLTLATSGVVALGVMRLGLTAANPALEQLQHLHGADLALFLAGTVPQLFGEELVTILPLLALLALFHRALGLPRGIALALAWALSAAIFAALHFPTYQWRIGQTLAIIGSARLALSLPYLITKTAWSSTIAHVTNDWLLFAIAVAASAFRAGVPA